MNTTNQADLVALALSRLANAQAANLVKIATAKASEPAPKAEKTPKAEKSAKAPKAAKSEKSEAKVVTSFPSSNEALDAKGFLARVKQIELDAAKAKVRTDPMVLMTACHAFIAYMVAFKVGWVKTLSPSMAPGALLDSCRLICNVMLDPSFTAEEDHSNREGERFIFGSAGANAKAIKMFGHLTSLLLQAEHLRMEFDGKALDASESARFADECEEFETAATLREECLMFQADSLTEAARADSIRAMIENLDTAKAEEMYDNAGKGEVVEETTIARGLLADEPMSAGGLHRVKMSAFIDQPVLPEFLSTTEVI